jgi:putative peptide zinc metalloprotease protein
LRRGTLVGPVGEGVPGEVAQTRTPVRLWVIPDASELPPLVGAAHRGTVNGPASVGMTAPRDGVHPGGVYPPLAVPPGPPDGTEDPDVDRRFERRMWWLVLLLLLLALLLTAVNFAPGRAWAEMAGNRVLLSADKGRITALINGASVTLDQGDRRFVAEGTRIDVPPAATGRLTFSGGAAALLCPGSRTEVGKISTGTGRTREPRGALAVDNGRLLADTTSVSGAYEPLTLVVRRPLGDVTNAGAAWYSVEPSAVSVSTGRVAVGGAPSSPTRSDLNCGDGVPVEPPAAGPSESPTPEPLPSDLLPSEVAPTATLTVPPPTTAPPVIQPPDDPDPTTTAPTTRPATRPATTRPTTKPTTKAPPTTPPSSPRPTPSSEPPSSSQTSTPPVIG